MISPILSLTLGSLFSGAQAGYSFITIGDWGGAALGSYHETAAHKVAKQMGQTASSSSANFVVNVGDNFYYCGLQNTSDSQIDTDYTSVYTAKSLQVPWYSALGNHEYGYNVQAQIDFTNIDPTKRWYLPSRYYTKRVALTSDEHMTVIVLDTNPCITAYRSESQKGWDPCGSDFPTCSPIDEGECKFHENILSQDCGAQFSWFKEQLTKVPKDDWLVVVGHHPAEEIDVQDFTSEMQNHGFDLYLAGHVHTLEHSSVDGKSAFVVSGAGSMVATKDQENDERCLYMANSNSTFQGAFKHSYQQVWSQKVAGFTLHTFSDDFKTLKTDFVSVDGDVVHSFSVQKGGNPGPSPPGPSPPTPPSPAPSPPGPSPPSPPSPGPSPPSPSGTCAGAGATWNKCKKGSGCTYVHASDEKSCGVSKYGCYDCSKLSAGCPSCKSEAVVVI